MPNKTMTIEGTREGPPGLCAVRINLRRLLQIDALWLPNGLREQQTAIRRSNGLTMPMHASQQRDGRG
jgi:hypothetical protein